MSKHNDWNKAIIKEFRANQGVVGGHFEGAALLLLHTIGAKSGKPRLNPVMYLPVDGQHLIIASKAGAPTNPDWYYNVSANPEVTVEVGAEKFEAVANILDEPARSEYFSKMAAKYPTFAEYQANTERVIPAILLSRK